MNAHVNEWRRHLARQKLRTSICDPAFRYQSSANTSVSRTFARERRRLRREQIQQTAALDAAPVIHLPYRATK